MGTTPMPPDVQASLFELLGLFTAYVGARTEKDRLALHQRILRLFERLGVASGLPEVRQAAEMFERIRAEPEPEALHEYSLAESARDLVNARLRVFHENKFNPRLSRGARDMLRIPIAEAADRANDLNKEQVITSLDTVLSSVRAEPTSVSEGDGRNRTSISVIRAFSLNFCNIPPFCSGTKK